jgi:hypothetical protein
MLRSIDGTNNGAFGIRTRPPSSKRKLGKTRSSHKIPCPICEKALLKQHVWDLNK